MAISLKITGINNAIRFITKKKLKVKKGISDGMIKGANLLKNEIKQSIEGKRAEPRSVDTGNFLNSIEMGTSKTSAIVFSDVEYAKFLEFGTVKMSERRHFRNSMTRNRNKIIKIVNNSIKKEV